MRQNRTAVEARQRFKRDVAHPRQHHHPSGAWMQSLPTYGTVLLVLSSRITSPVNMLRQGSARLYPASFAESSQNDAREMRNFTHFPTHKRSHGLRNTQHASSDIHPRSYMLLDPISPSASITFGLNPSAISHQYQQTEPKVISLTSKTIEVQYLPYCAKRVPFFCQVYSGCAR